MDIVMDYIRILGAECIRVNSFDLLNSPLQFSSHSSVIEVNGVSIQPSTIGAVWFRKFGFFSRSFQYATMKKILEPLAQSYLSAEFSRVLEAFQYGFQGSFWLTDPRYIRLNKYLVLMSAKEIGFSIPPTYITNDLERLSEISRKEGGLISKSIFDPLIIHLKDKDYTMYTTKIEEDEIARLPKSFLPSMVQKSINKQFEVRVFYLLGECFSMAIMSQENSNTSVDFRKYDFKHPNRFLPIKLPVSIEDKVHRLMCSLSLNTGSLDFIVTPEGEFVFLEVNPTGQFGMIDFSCNYGLHEKIARVLISKDLECNGKSAI